MAYTSEAEVRKIIDISDDVTDLTPFITAASAMVTAHCTNIGESDAAIVETWLAAHLITIRDNRVSSEGVEGASESFQFKLNDGLACSMYGQTAMQVDPTGGLSSWNESVISGKAGRTATVTWLGTSSTN